MGKVFTLPYLTVILWIVVNLIWKIVFFKNTSTRRFFNSRKGVYDNSQGMKTV